MEFGINKTRIIITPRILITLYRGHLPVSWGHLDPEGGKTWLGVSTAEGYGGKGYGTRVVKELCKFADKAGWNLWLTCKHGLVKWYKTFGFKVKEVDITNGEVYYMRRGYVRRDD